MESFKEFFYNSMKSITEDKFTINISGTENGEDKVYSISVEANDDSDAMEKAKEKLEDMKDNGSVPSDATIQNIES